MYWRMLKIGDGQEMLVNFENIVTIERQDKKLFFTTVRGDDAGITYLTISSAKAALKRLENLLVIPTINMVQSHK